MTNDLSKLESVIFRVMYADYQSMPSSQREAIILDVFEQDRESQKMFRGVWGRMSHALQTFYEHSGLGPPPGWTRWKPGDWFEQSGTADRQKYAAWVGPAVVGLLNIRPGYDSAYEDGQKLVYVEHLASSPGDIGTHIWGRNLRGVGTALMGFAVLQSCLKGFDGRIGLHASDSEAKSFYDRFNRTHGIFCDPPKKDVPGTPQDPKARDRFYFESIPEQAREFLLKEFGHARDQDDPTPT